MRIGVDATCWQNSRGYGRHVRGLLSALVRIDSGNHYTLFVDSEGDLISMPLEAEAKAVQTSLPAALAASANGHRSISDAYKMSRAISSILH